MGEGTAVSVHRCRFVDFCPSTITTLAFSPLTPPSTKRQKALEKPASGFGTLGVGHTNGTIDIYEWTGSEHQYSSPQAWAVRKTLTGPYPSKIDSLAFAIRSPDSFGPDQIPSTSDLRLFSSGGGSDLVEWDLTRGCVRRTIRSQGGAIWSLAVNPTSTLLALGCEDGSVHLLSLLLDTLTHHRRFDRVKSRLLSIAWGPPIPRQTTNKQHGSDETSDDDDEEDWHDTWIVAGGSDSCLTKWDVSTGKALDRMKTDKLRGERTLVWAVGVLGDGTIVSGDSLGMVKFWDPRTCTQLQSFQAHGADVLCLTIGPEGKTIYTSGIDQKITQFSLVKKSVTADSTLYKPHPSLHWAQSISRRLHSHDVRALHTWPPYATFPPSHQRAFPVDVAPILASGGLDMSVVLTPAALPESTVVKVTNPLSTGTESIFELSHHYRLAYPCGPSSTISVCVARKARLVSCMRDTSLSLWKIFPKQTPSSENLLENDLHDPTYHGGWEKILDMDFNVHTNLLASALSDNGQWLVVSDLYETKLFTIKNDKQGNIKPRRIRDLSSLLHPHTTSLPLSTGGSAFTFTPDSSRLVMATASSAHIVVIDLGNDDRPSSVIRRFDHHRRHPGDRAMKSRQFSEDVEMDSTDGDTSSVAVNILRLAVSGDGQWLASSDDHCRTHIFNLDSMQHHCSLPSFPQPTQTLAFDPSHPNILIMGLCNNTIQVFDVELRQFPSWSKHLSNSLFKTRDPILGLTFDPTATEAAPTGPGPSQALFWGSTWICKIKLDDRPPPSASGKKRRRENKKQQAVGSLAAIEKNEIVTHEQPQDRKLTTRFRPILCVDFLSPGEMVVVERPLVDILVNLPPAYFRHKYGAS